MDQDRLEKLVRQAYEEMFALRKLPGMGAVVKNKMTMLYGPPMMRPDLALVSFQGGSEDKSPQLTTWPEQLLYLNDPYRFGPESPTSFQGCGNLRNITIKHHCVCCSVPGGGFSGGWQMDAPDGSVGGVAQVFLRLGKAAVASNATSRDYRVWS